MNKPLVHKTYNDSYQELDFCLLKLRSQNDALMASIDSDINKTDFYSQLKLQKISMDSFVEEIKQLLTQTEKLAKSMTQKNQTKSAKETFLKELERFRAIYKQLNSRSSFGNTKVRQSSEEPQMKDNPMPVHQIQYSIIEREDFGQSELDNQILKENQEEISQIETQATQIKNILTTMDKEIFAQDEQLDVATGITLTTKQNLQETNQELIAATEIQEQSRKWYWVLAFLIVFFTCVVVLIMYFEEII